YLGDLGLAKVIQGNNKATVAGTKIYIAPEVWKDNKMDFGSDLYAVGICIYELITGKHPFAAKSQNEMIQRMKNEQPGNLPDYVPTELKELILSLLNVV
ncbi:MAG: hypothetical protein EZS28_049605, partial [Streblomastix strix]